MPSTRGFADRRRGVRDSRLPPCIQTTRVRTPRRTHEAFTPARSHANYTIDIARQGSYWGEGLRRVWRPRRAVGESPRPRAGGKKLLLPGAHFRRYPLSP